MGVSSAIRCVTLGKSLIFHAERDLFIDSLIQPLASYQMFIDTGPGPGAEGTWGEPHFPLTFSCCRESLWNLFKL